MDPHCSSPKELAQTAASFYARPAFEYRSHESALDYSLLRQNQKERISDLFRSDPFFNEDKLLAEVERAEEENTQFIQSLLNQLAAECKKLRTLQSNHEAALALHNTQARILAEDNMQLTAELQMERKGRQAQKKKIERQFQDSQKHCFSLQKEQEGLRRLLEEYESELEAANERIDQQMLQMAANGQGTRLMLAKIQQLSLIVNHYQCQLEQKCRENTSLMQQIAEGREVEAHIAKYSKEIQDLRQLNAQLTKQIEQARRENVQKITLIEHLEMRLLEANGEVINQENHCQQLHQTTATANQLFQDRENHWKNLLKELEGKAREGIEKLKINYERKIRKIMGYYEKEVKALRWQVSRTKEEVQKEMLVCFKLMQRDLKQEAKSIFKLKY